MEEYVTSSFYNEVLDSNPNLVNISYKAYEVLDDPTQITK